MTLTEQWDKGKLPEGDYYIKRRNGDFLYDNIDTSGVWCNSIDEDILEILSPVPSYEEWEAKDSQIDYLQQKVSVFESENAKLKELLKECRDVIKDVDTYCTKNADEGYILIYRIDQVIGEK